MANTYGTLADGRTWYLHHTPGQPWRVIAGWGDDNETYHEIYQGSMERCVAHVIELGAA